MLTALDDAIWIRQHDGAYHALCTTVVRLEDSRLRVHSPTPLARGPGPAGIIDRAARHAPA